MKPALNQQATRTTNGTQNWTDASITSDQTLQLLFGTECLANNTGTANGKLVIGATDLSSSVNLAFQTLDATTASSAAATTTGSSTSCVVRRVSSGTATLSAAYSATLSNGDTLNYGTTDATAYLFNALSLAGSDHVCHLSNTTFGTADTSKVVTHGDSSAPDAVILLFSYPSTGTDVNAFPQKGIIAFWDGTNSVSLSTLCSTQVSPTLLAGRLTTDLGHQLDNFGANVANFSIGSVGATTFTLTRSATGTVGVFVTCISIRHLSGTWGCKAGVTTTPTSTGNSVLITGMSAAPQVLLTVASRLTSSSLATNSDAAGSISFGVACNNSGTTQQYAIATTNKNNVATTVSKQYISNNAALLSLDNTGAVANKATVNSWNSDGVTLNHSVVNATAFEMMYLAFGIGSGSLTLTSVGGTNILTDTQTNVAIVCAGAGASQGGGTVKILDGATSVTQTVVDWIDTLIHINVVRSASRYGSVLIKVTNNSGQSATQVITLNAASGTVVNLGTPRALSFDANNCPTRLYDTPTDIPTGSQILLSTTGGSGSITIDTDGRASGPTTVTQFQWAWNNGAGWSSNYLWDWRGIFPSAFSIPNQSANVGDTVSWNFAQYFTESDPGSAPLTYALQAGSWPVGITLNSSTAVASGTTSVAFQASNLVIRATNVDGSYVDSPAFGVLVAPLIPAVVFTGTIADVSLVVGQIVLLDITSYFTNATGYTVTGSLPTGLVFLNGVFTGTVAPFGTPGQTQTYPLTVSGTNAVPPPATSNTFNLKVTVPAVTGNVVKSNVITSLNNIQNRGINNSLPLIQVAECVFTSADGAQTAYSFIRLSSSARIMSLELMNDANPTGSSYICGLLRAGNYQLPVPFSDRVLCPPFSLDAARLQWAPIYYPALPNQSSSIANLGKALWELLGLSKDPGDSYEIVITAINPGTSSGNMALRCEYLQ